MERRTFLKGTLRLGAAVAFGQGVAAGTASAVGASPFQIWLQWPDPNADALNKPDQFEDHAAQYSSAFADLNRAIAATGRAVSAPLVNGGCRVAQEMGPGSFWTASLFGENPDGLAVPWDTGPQIRSLAPNLWGKVMQYQNTCGVSPTRPDVANLSTASVFGLVMQMALKTIPSIIVRGTGQGPQPFNPDGSPVVSVNTNIGSGVTGFGPNILETRPPTGVLGVRDAGKPFQVWLQWRTFDLVNGQKVGNAAQMWVDNMNAMVKGLTNQGMYISAAGCSPVFNYGQEDNFIVTIAQKAPNPLNNNEIDKFLFWSVSLFGFDGVPSGQSSETLWDSVCASGAHAGPVGYFLNLLEGSGPLSPLLKAGERATYAKGVDRSSISSLVNVSSENGREPLAEFFLQTT
jgi:hypothetical protein